MEKMNCWKFLCNLLELTCESIWDKKFLEFEYFFFF